MAEMQFDGYLELVPNQQTMKVRMQGESLDTRHSSGGAAAFIEIDSFNFGGAKALAAATKRQQAEERAEEAQGGAPVKTDPIKGARGDNLDDNYRFQITKQIERASPHLLMAYFSNSFKKKRKEYNDFTEARVILRKAVGRSQGPKPYLQFKFSKVRVVGYTLAVDGTDPPRETVAFCFRACEVNYRQQDESGEMAVPIIRGWNFEEHKDKKK